MLSPDGVAASRMVGMSVSVSLPCTIKSRSSFLAPAHLGGPGKRDIKWLWCGGCDQMAGWINMPLGREVGLGPCYVVLDGDPAPPPKKGAQQPPIFGSCLLWPNGWIDQDAT